MTSKSMSPEVAIDDRDRPVVIVGAGHAGIQSADALRSEGYDGPIVLVEGDAAFPYQRPPLSKDFLGEQDTEPLPLPLRAESFLPTALSTSAPVSQRRASIEPPAD